MDRTLQKRVTFVFGIILAVAMALSLVLPLLSQNAGLHTQAIPTDQPTPTPLPQIQDVSDINFDESYLHPSGLYTVAVPSEWTVANSYANFNEAQVSIEHAPSNSITEVRVMDADMPLEAVEDLDNLFTSGWLESSWRSFASWEETNRFVEDGEHIMSFNLELNNRNFIARQKAWFDDDWTYIVRVITPDLGSDMLLFVLDGVSDSLEPNAQFADTPISWSSYFDDTTRHIIRYPQDFSVTDSAVGAPATIVGDGIAMRVETIAGAISDESAAQDWITSWRSDAEIQTVEPVESDGYTGYLVSYSLMTLDGESEAGLAMILNGSNEQVHVANMQVANESNDLLDDTAFPEGNAYREIIETFTVLPDTAVATAE